MQWTSAIQTGSSAAGSEGNSAKQNGSSDAVADVSMEVRNSSSSCGNSESKRGPWELEVWKIQKLQSI